MNSMARHLVSLGSLLTALVAASCTQAPASSQPDTAVDDTAEARALVIEATRSIASGADARSWDVVEDAFAGRVVLDYGVPELLTPAEIVDRWQPLMEAFDSTEHALSDIEVSFPEADRALVRSNFRATHTIAGAPGGDTWVLEGRYEHEAMLIDGQWRVTRMRMIPGASSGNGGLIDVARQKAGLSAPAPAPYRVEHVSFTSGGDELVGLLHLPAEATPGEELPVVIVTGSWTTVKEQMPALYAQRLASAGYAALTFDFRGFGQSEGAPRNYESPTRKIEDIRAAMGFVTGYAGIDPDRVALLGVCASAGYAAAAAAEDPRAKSLALVAPWLHDANFVQMIYGPKSAYGEDGVAGRVAAGEEARARFEATGQVDYVPGASSTDARAAMYQEDPTVLDYYLNVSRGGIPQWGNRFAVMSWPEWLEFDAMAAAPKLTTPTLVVHTEQGAIPDGAKQFVAAMPNPTTIDWTAGTQFHFYDDPTTIDAAVAKVVVHLDSTLGAQ